MNTQEKIEKLEKCLEILEAVQIYENKISMEEYDLTHGTFAYFPSIVKRSKHNLIIYKMCIDRLNERYLKQLNK